MESYVALISLSSRMSPAGHGEMMCRSRRSRCDSPFRSPGRTRRSRLLNVPGHARCACAAACSILQWAADLGMRDTDRIETYYRGRELEGPVEGSSLAA